MSLRRCLCPPCSISWAQRVLATVAVPSLFLFVGTAWACDGGCALLVSFHGHSVRSWRCLCPPCFFSWAQHGLATVSVPSLFLFVGTVWVPDGVCALLVSFRGHSMSLRRWLCPPCFFSWAQYGFLTASVPSLFLFMGTVWVPDGVCALLVSFHGHSVCLRRWLCPRPTPSDTDSTYP